MKYQLTYEQQQARKKEIEKLEKLTRECLNNLYKLKAHKELKKLISEVSVCYRPKPSKKYDINEPVKNPVKASTRAALDKKILGR